MSSSRNVLYQLCANKEWQPPDYTTEKSGPDHFPSFYSTVTVNGTVFASKLATRIVKKSLENAASIAVLQLMAAPTADEVHNGGAKKAEVEISFTAVKPKLVVEAFIPIGNEAVEFYRAAFGALVTSHINLKRKADQKLPIFSAQLQLSDSTILVSDNSNDSAYLCLQTEDVYATVAKAITAGATPIGETAESDGVWCGKVKDPYGFVWLICSAPTFETGTEVEA
ncbi:Uncharacterized protein At5g48480 [Linum perenne]